MTIDYVEQKFAEFNDMFFDGELELPPIRINNARRTMGMVRYRCKRYADGSYHFRDFEFVMSKKCENIECEQTVEDIIIHEMIHYHILSNQMEDSGPHGFIFMGIMMDINRRFGRNISVTHERTREEKDKDTEFRPHHVCVARFLDGEYGVVVSARTRLFELWEAIPTLPDVAEVTWYGCHDPFFNRFPRSITPKLYEITRAELDEHLAYAVKLVKKGNRIMVE